ARLRQLRLTVELVPVEPLPSEPHRPPAHQLHPQLLDREAGAIGRGPPLDRAGQLEADAVQRQFERLAQRGVAGGSHRRARSTSAGWATSITRSSEPSPSSAKSGRRTNRELRSSVWSREPVTRPYLSPAGAPWRGTKWKAVAIRCSLMRSMKARRPS